MAPPGLTPSRGRYLHDEPPLSVTPVLSVLSHAGAVCHAASVRRVEASKSKRAYLTHLTSVTPNDGKDFT